MQGKWEVNTDKYGTGEKYRIGKVVVANFHIGSVSRGDPIKYRCQIELPGIRIKSEFEYHETIESAKAQVERSVGVWFKWIKDNG